MFINLLIENDFIQKITQVKYINSLCSFEHREIENKYVLRSSFINRSSSKHGNYMNKSDFIPKLYM